MGVFVRLLDAAGGTPTTALARGSSHPDGLYSASVVVPAGGVSGIQIGLHGTTDIYAALLNNPFGAQPAASPARARPRREVPRRNERSGDPVRESLPRRQGARRRAGCSRSWARARPCASDRRSNFQSSRWGGQKVLWFVLPVSARARSLIRRLVRGY